MAAPPCEPTKTWPRAEGALNLRKSNGSWVLYSKCWKSHTVSNNCSSRHHPMYVPYSLDIGNLFRQICNTLQIDGPYLLTLINPHTIPMALTQTSARLNSNHLLREKKQKPHISFFRFLSHSYLAPSKGGISCDIIHIIHIIPKLWPFTSSNDLWISNGRLGFPQIGNQGLEFPQHTQDVPPQVLRSG